MLAHHTDQKMYALYTSKARCSRLLTSGSPHAGHVPGSETRTPAISYPERSHWVHPRRLRGGRMGVLDRRGEAGRVRRRGRGGARITCRCRTRLGGRREACVRGDGDWDLYRDPPVGRRCALSFSNITATAYAQCKYRRVTHAATRRSATITRTPLPEGVGPFFEYAGLGCSIGGQRRKAGGFAIIEESIMTSRVFPCKALFPQHVLLVHIHRNIIHSSQA